MRVTVMTPSRTKMLLDDVDTLRDVKRQIMTRTGIPARQQLVYFRGKQLKSLRRPLSSYHVRDGSTLYLVKRLSICRCLACRNSRYIEREEVEEERLQLMRLLGDAPLNDDLSSDDVTSQVDMTSQVAIGPEMEVSRDYNGGSVAVTWPVSGYRRQLSPETDADLAAERMASPEAVEGETEAAEDDDDSAEVVGDDFAEGQVMEELDDEALEMDDNAEETAEEVEEEEEEELEETDGGAEDIEEAEETEEANQDPDDVEADDEEEEAMDEVAGETEDLNEENDEADAAEEDLELSGEEADDEEEHEEEAAEEEEEVEILEPEDTEEEPVVDTAEDAAEETHEDANEEDEEDATILYSLVTGGREDSSRRREEAQGTADGADADAEDEDAEDDDRPAEPVFVRQQAFQEDGANSVGEEDPDITELEDDEEQTHEASALTTAEENIPERVEDLLLSMTRPTPDPEEEDDSQEEQYPEDDPLFDPPDEEDPLLASRDAEDAGYISGDEMDRV